MTGTDSSCENSSSSSSPLNHNNLKRLREAEIKLEFFSDANTDSENEEVLPKRRKKISKKSFYTQVELKKGLKLIYPEKLREKNDSNCLSNAKEVCIWLGEGRVEPTPAQLEDPVDTILFDNHQDDGPPRLAYAKVDSSSSSDALNLPEEVYYLEEDKTFLEEKPNLLLRSGKLSQLESDLENLNLGNDLNESQVALIYLQFRNPIVNTEGRIIEGHYLNMYISGSKGKRQYRILDASEEEKYQVVSLRTFLKSQGQLFQDEFLYRFHNRNDIHFGLRTLTPKLERSL